MFTTISSFNEIEIKPDETYLVICDIDGTVLHFPNCDRFCRELLNDFYLSNGNYATDLEQMKSIYRRMRAPTHTDKEGFDSMCKTLEKTNSKILFLTARGSNSYKLTKTHLKQVGILPDEFDIHYTSTLISKGEYIKTHIDLSNWKNVIFIDDFETNIRSVSDIYPQIVCYKFAV